MGSIAVSVGAGAEGFVGARVGMLVGSGAGAAQAARINIKPATISRIGFNLKFIFSPKIHIR
jgi:hypothetical protein